MLIINFLFFIVQFSVLFGDSVFTEDEELNIDTYINNLLQCRDVPGISLAVVRNGNVFAQGYGQADIENRINATNSTVFCLGSVTKSFTAMLLARLISSGKYRLDWTSKLKDVLGDEYKFYDECMTDSITLEDVLSHRTGLASADLLLQAGVPKSVSREHLMKNLNYLPKIMEFRDTFFYNNLVYVMGGHVAEKVTNKPWEQLMKDELFDPMNMTSTVLIDDISGEDLPTIAVPYILNNKNELYRSSKSIYRLHPFGPAGSVCSSARDLTSWLKLITSRGMNNGLRIITEPAFDKQFQPKSTLENMWQMAYSLVPPFPVLFDNYGYGIGWFTSYYRGHKLLYHSGSFYGYSCKIAYLPDSKTAFIFSTNGPGEAKFDETINPIFFYLLDTILGLTPWLNGTTACTYPSPWVVQRGKRSVELPTKEADTSDMYSGVYSHSLYGQVIVSKINDSFHLSYGVLLKGVLIKSRYSFVLRIEGPLQDVILSSVIVSFDNLSPSNKYSYIKLNLSFETYKFRRVEEKLVNKCNRKTQQWTVIMSMILVTSYYI